MLLLLLAFIVIASIITNPFSRLSIVRKPLVASFNKTTIEISKKQNIIVRNNWYWVFFSVIKSGFHILESRYFNSPRSNKKTADGIIKDIHTLRFDTSKLLIVSGDHFISLFVRNLGVFYYPLLDGKINSSKDDWHNRQIIYLETIAFAIDTFHQFGHLSTTIVPTSRNGVTCVNFYAYPSDSLYGILYGLAVMMGLETSRALDYKAAEQELSTKKASKILLSDYKDTLKKLYNEYLNKIYDKKTGLISKDMELSGAKDITKRRSAFYDNVILWKTTQLAVKLGLIEDKALWLENYKKKILKTFWQEDLGYFLEDLSEECQENKYYSSDWLVVLFTGFLNPQLKGERKYYEKNVEYIESEKLDQPFAIKYQKNTQAKRQFLAVKIAVASYGGDAIWSFWGMEYIKTLLILYKLTEKETYLTRADYHIAKYKKLIMRNGGFPEVYDRNGKLLQTWAYRSIRQTGWVIGFEQVLALRQALFS
ncbi:MAG: hypothetical protein ACHQT9_03525 [Candidatus Saccharimonadales bacterium]